MIASAAARCLGCLLAAALPAQTSLHAAWLREVLDLDIDAAAKAYARIADDRMAPGLERLVALARTAELRMHGVGGGEPVLDLSIVPEVLRQHFHLTQQGDQPVLQRELEAGKGDHAAVAQFFSTTEVPQLRPLVVATVLAAAEQANPSATDRMRQWRMRFSPWSNDPARVLDRIRANDIVRAELDGNAEEAATLRRRAFPNWRPQPWPLDTSAAWARVQANLTEWQRERQLTSSERELLRRLEKELARRAEQDTAAALRLLDHMPLHAERLRVGVAEPR